MTDYAANIMAQIHQTIDDGLKHIAAQKRIRELEEERRRLQEQLTWAERERDDLMAEIGEGIDGN